MATHAVVVGAVGLLLAVGGVSAARAADGLCSPSFVDLGAISATETFLTVSCVPLQLPVPESVLTAYGATFEFLVVQPADFYLYVGGSNRMPNQAAPYWSGIGIQGADLYFGDIRVTGGSGSGIGGSERPVILNPDFAVSPEARAAGFGRSFSDEPAGTYQVRVIGRGFGPTQDGGISVRLMGSFASDPVTPVPEPATFAMQALGVGLLAMAMARARRRRIVAAHT